MWVFTGQRKYIDDGTEHLIPVEPMAGLGPGPLTDAEFEAAVARLEAQHDDEERGAIVASGIYQHRDDDLEAGGPDWAARLEEGKPQPAEENSRSRGRSRAGTTEEE